MDGSWFFDKNFNGVPDDFFEDAMKYFDFPMEDVEPHKEEEEEDWEAQFQHIKPPPSNVLKGFSSGVRSDDSNGTSNVKKSLSNTPSTGEASSRSLPLHYDSLEGNYLHRFRTSSPVSVLESSSNSSSSYSGGNPTSNHPRFVVPVKRPRSKRHLQRRACPFMFSSSAFKRFCPLFALESKSESQKISNPAKKKKERNLTQLSCTLEINKPSMQQPVETRKCAHCGVTKTPQWREGPTGPKTLCNACGVRYRSGRLLPEYRPAASPTFVPSLHSNSHRKVLEMRKKDTQVISTAAAPKY